MAHIIFFLPILTFTCLEFIFLVKFHSLLKKQNPLIFFWSSPKVKFQNQEYNLCNMIYALIWMPHDNIFHHQHLFLGLTQRHRWELLNSTGLVFRLLCVIELFPRKSIARTVFPILGFCSYTDVAVNNCFLLLWYLKSGD